MHAHTHTHVDTHTPTHLTFRRHWFEPKAGALVLTLQSTCTLEPSGFGRSHVGSSECEGGKLRGTVLLWNHSAFLTAFICIFADVNLLAGKQATAQPHCVGIWLWLLLGWCCGLNTGPSALNALQQATTLDLTYFIVYLFYCGFRFCFIFLLWRFF